MNKLFADMLNKLRTEKGLSQTQLANRMMVNRTTVSRWENGSRLPDAAMISRLSRVLEVNASVLFSAVVGSDEAPNIIMVDDEAIILSGGLPVLEEAFPELETEIVYGGQPVYRYLAGLS